MCVILPLCSRLTVLLVLYQLDFEKIAWTHKGSTPICTADYVTPSPLVFLREEEVQSLYREICVSDDCSQIDDEKFNQHFTSILPTSPYYFSIYHAQNRVYREFFKFLITISIS